MYILVPFVSYVFAFWSGIDRIRGNSSERSDFRVWDVSLTFSGLGCVPHLLMLRVWDVLLAF